MTSTRAAARASDALAIATEDCYIAFSKGFPMASVYYPVNKFQWRDRRAPDLADFERLAAAAYRELPPEFRTLTGEVVIRVADFPDEDVADDLALETPFDLLGLFEGRGVAEKWNPQTGEWPNRVTLYRRPILDYWAEQDETLGDIITHVLVHEIGHHFGLSDDDMARIEESAG